MIFFGCPDFLCIMRDFYADPIPVESFLDLVNKSNKMARPLFLLLRLVNFSFLLIQNMTNKYYGILIINI